MPTDDLLLRRALVFASALIYWGGVWIQARRVRRSIGRSPNVAPRGPKERLLWLGWFLVVLSWLGQPFLARDRSALPGLSLYPVVAPVVSLTAGLGLLIAGYAATLWCYAAMGAGWRMGINPGEKTALVTRGPYRRVRHPIYLFQIVMLLGVWLLLPTALFIGVILLHLICVWIKAADEESYLLGLHGEVYRDYLAHTGRLWPRG